MLKMGKSGDKEKKEKAAAKMSIWERFGLKVKEMQFSEDSIKQSLWTKHVEYLCSV